VVRIHSPRPIQPFSIHSDIGTSGMDRLSGFLATGLRFLPTLGISRTGDSRASAQGKL
jgi:hypothetical protein